MYLPVWLFRTGINGITWNQLKSINPDCCFGKIISTSDRKERVSFWQPLKDMEIWVGTVGTNNLVFCSDSIHLLFSENFKRCLLRAGSVIIYGPLSGFYYYNMKPQTRLLPYPRHEDALGSSVGFGTWKVRSIFHIWCTYLYSIISKWESTRLIYLRHILLMRLPATSQESESCICVLEGSDFAWCYKFSIRFWNCLIFTTCKLPQRS